MPEMEAASVRSGLKGEEKSFFEEKVRKLHETITSLPQLYEQDGMGGGAVAYLHYFHPGGSDWLITEYDGNRTFFGFSCLNRDTLNAELGYIDLRELCSVGAELDLHFEPRPLCIAKAETIFGMTAAEAAFDAVQQDDIRSLQACLEAGVRPDAVCDAYNSMTLEDYAMSMASHRCRKLVAEAADRLAEEEESSPSP